MIIDKAFDAYISVPRMYLSSSANVDLLLLLACDKPAIRTRLSNPEGIHELNAWCNSHNLTLVGEEDEYVCISHDKSIASLVLKLDRMMQPHELELGLVLGYPSCCCRFVQKVGEPNIDLLASKISTWIFQDKFCIINPSLYLEGRSLISHLPCSTTCEASLQIAEKAKHFVMTYRDEAIFEPLTFWLND